MPTIRSFVVIVAGVCDANAAVNADTGPECDDDDDDDALGGDGVVVGRVVIKGVSAALVGCVFDIDAGVVVVVAAVAVVVVVG